MWWNMLSLFGPLANWTILRKTYLPYFFSGAPWNKYQNLHCQNSVTLVIYSFVGWHPFNMPLYILIWWLIWGIDFPISFKEPLDELVHHGDQSLTRETQKVVCCSMGTHFIQNKSTKAADICLNIPNLSWHSEDLGTTSLLLCHGMHEEDPLHEDVLLGTVHL